MKGNSLTYKVENGIAYLTLSHPPANVMNTVFFEELYEICQNYIITEDFDGLIVRSTGRHFSSGADISELVQIIDASASETVPARLAKNSDIFKILFNLKKPSVSLINGICYGSGFELALATRYRIATPKSLFALPESTFGLMPGLGGIHALSGIVGMAGALELVLSGHAFNADEALKWGLVNHICKKDELEVGALACVYSGRAEAF